MGKINGVSCQLSYVAFADNPYSEKSSENSGDVIMDSYSRSIDGNNSKKSPFEVESNVCQVCKGRKYTLVATSKPNESSTVYERQECQACSIEPSHGSDDAGKEKRLNGKRTLSGTGYLRNKKRRRKAST